jgi:hypothetical protein
LGGNEVSLLIPFSSSAKAPLVLVKHNLATHQFNSLDEAMAFAKELGEFVTIQFDGKEVVGVFGATGVTDGKCPDGMDYSWKKRRR